MPSPRNALPVLVAACVLAGCGAPSGGDKSAAKAGPAAPAAPVATPAAVATTAKGAPRRRDGYWEFVSMGASGTEMGKQFLCVGANSEDDFSLFDQLAAAGDCSKRDFKRTATGWDFETQCEIMNVVTVQKGVISGDFQNSFQVDQTVTQSPNTKIQGSIRGRRVGDCPAQFKPGDLVDGDGSKLANMLG
jgi:hypothetical protein